MTRRLLSKLSSVLSSQWPDQVHFHGGANGAYICEDPHCVSPHLDPTRP